MPSGLRAARAVRWEHGITPQSTPVGLMIVPSDADLRVAPRPTHVGSRARGRHVTTRDALETWGLSVVERFDGVSRLVQVEGHEQFVKVIVTS